jgi:hypothetical protein
MYQMCQVNHNRCLKFAYREYASGMLTREECPILNGERLGCKGEKDGGLQSK